jgi:UDP-3-O-[3-hydroxymyristoyl] glucosamine N-acyltransferase
MKFTSPISVQKIAELMQAELIMGDCSEVLGLNEIHFVEQGDLVFVDHPKYYEKALTSKASFVIIDQKPQNTHSKTLLIHPKPFQVFNNLIRDLKPLEHTEKPISDDVKIGKGTIIQPNVSISKHVTIGEDCIIHPGVVIYSDTIIGNRVVIHANTVIGSDAFYYNKKEGKYTKFTSCGGVHIENDVEIGASCTIDKGVTATTKIGAGTKLDNQVHIGHDTQIGNHCLMAAQVGIAGVCTIKDNVTLWGQVGVASNVVIEEGVVVLGQSGVTKSLKSGKIYFGCPVEEAGKRMKELAALRQLPHMMSKQNQAS